MCDAGALPHHRLYLGAPCPAVLWSSVPCSSQVQLQGAQCSSALKARPPERFRQQNVVASIWCCLHWHAEHAASGAWQSPCRFEVRAAWSHREPAPAQENGGFGRRGALPSRSDVAMLWAWKAEHWAKGDYSWALRFNVICLIRFWIYMRLLLLSCFSLLELECLFYACPTIVLWKCIACLVLQVRKWGGVCSGWPILQVSPVYDLDDV